MSYYEPKKVFVKTENGAYTEITYQEFCKRRNADPSYKKRFFIPIQGSLLEVNEDTYRDFYQAKEREDYVDECRQDVGEISYETLQDSVNDYKTVDGPHEELVRRTKYAKMWKCFAELSEDDSFIIEMIYFERMKEEDLAKILGISQAAVNKRKHKILKKLRKKMLK